MNNDHPENQPVILSAVRTPMGRFRGALSSIPAPRLGAIVVQEALKRAEISNPADVAEVIMGNVVSAGLGQNPARQASIFGDLPETVGAMTINKVCGSGLKSAMLAAQGVRAGDGQLYIAGGMESMSRAPEILEGRLGELRYGNVQMRDSLLYDGLWDPFEDWSMGDAAEFIAEEYEVTREAMDKFAFESHMKAIAAQDNGKFNAEIVPVEVAGRKGSVTIVDQDETPRRDTSMEALTNLRPVFRKDGKVTAGNAPGLNDGAAAVVIASMAQAQALGKTPLARIAGYSQAAVKPKFLFDAPSKAVPKLLDYVGWTFEDVDLIELNEAFAAQTLANGYAMTEMGWDWGKVNVHGGAIALGHPIGASGARILTTLIYALKDRGLQRGIAGLCLGGAEAVSMAIELIN